MANIGNRGYIPPSQKTDWETPSDLFDALWDEFKGFDLDPCGQVGQHTVMKVWGHGGTVYVPPGSDITNLYRVAIDGLIQPWHGRVFMNPPYPAGEWVTKARSEVERPGGPTIVVALLKVTTDVRWWHEHVERIAQVRFIKGRLRFKGSKAPAPFPSCIVIWRRTA